MNEKEKQNKAWCDRCTDYHDLNHYCFTGENKKIIKVGRLNFENNKTNRETERIKKECFKEWDKKKTGAGLNA